MKQSDAAWFSGPGTPFSAGGPSLTEHVRWRADTDALIQRLAFHRPLSSHTGSAVSCGLGLLQSSIILPRVHRCHGNPAGPARVGSTLRRVPRRGYQLRRPDGAPLPSSSSPSPNLFTSTSSPPAFSPPARPLLHLRNMWKRLRRETGSGMNALNPNQRFRAKRGFTFVWKHCESFTSNLKGSL